MNQTAKELSHKPKTLTKEQGKALLTAVDRATISGKRDYAILLLLMYTGIQRLEASSLSLSSLDQDHGYPVATIKTAKKNEQRRIKLPTVVMEAIMEYLNSSGRTQLNPDAPLFVRIRRENKITEEALRPQGIELIVSRYAEIIGLEKLNPQDLRATFIVMALENGAKLEDVQYNVGHRDPKTTKRYQKVDKVNGTNLSSASDYIDF